MFSLAGDNIFPYHSHKPQNELRKETALPLPVIANKAVYRNKTNENHRLKRLLTYTHTKRIFYMKTFFYRTACRVFSHGLLMPNLHGSYTLKNSFYEIELLPCSRSSNSKIQPTLFRLWSCLLVKVFFWLALCSATV